MKPTLFTILCGAALINVLVSCKNNSSAPQFQPSTAPSEVSSANDDSLILNIPSSLTIDDSYHEDPNYKYEYRTGASGDYEYNYDVSGSDNEGNSVSGNIDIQGKYGTGTIVDDNGNEKDVDVEWVGYGELEATDIDGETYELEVD